MGPRVQGLLGTEAFGRLEPLAARPAPAGSPGAAHGGPREPAWSLASQQPRGSLGKQGSPQTRREEADSPRRGWRASERQLQKSKRTFQKSACRAPSSLERAESCMPCFAFPHPHPPAQRPRKKSSAENKINRIETKLGCPKVQGREKKREASSLYPLHSYPCLPRWWRWALPRAAEGR